jgi:hypothetical protein
MAKPGRLIRIAANLLRPKMGYRHLFVYGAYLDENLLRERCPDPEFVTLAHYDNRRFMINSEGLATASPRQGYRVYGVVWSVPEIGLAALDIHAGVPHWHDRFGAFARTASGQLCVSEFFATRNRTLGRADPAYLHPIIAAAWRWKFPQQYIEEIGGWARLEPHPRGTRRGAR